MKRPAATIAIFILVGVVLNVVVAWALALWAPAVPIRRGNWAELTEAQAREFWTRYLPQDWSGVPDPGAVRQLAAGRGSTAVMSTVRDPEDPEAPGRTGDIRAIAEHVHGWPAPSLSHVQYIEVTSGSARSWIEGAIRLPASVQLRGLTISRSLPYRPLVFGFALNAMFFATLSLGAVMIPPYIRRDRRRRRGLCEGCGYRLTGAAHARCPECGRDLDHVG